MDYRTKSWYPYSKSSLLEDLVKLGGDVDSEITGVFPKRVEQQTNTSNSAAVVCDQGIPLM